MKQKAKVVLKYSQVRPFFCLFNNEKLGSDYCEFKFGNNPPFTFIFALLNKYFLLIKLV